MQILFSFIFSLICVIVVHAQNLDSLLHVANSSKDNASKVRALLDISDYWSYRDTAKGFYYLEQANKIIEDDYLRGIYHFYKGQNLFDYYSKKAQQAYMKADEMLKKYNKKEAYYYRTRSWHNYAAIEQLSGREANYLKILTEICISLARKSDDKILLASQYSDIGLALKNQKQYEKSISYLRQSSDIITKEPYSVRKGEKLIEIFGQLGEMYLYEMDTLQAKNVIDTLNFLMKQFPQATTGIYYYYANGKYYQQQQNYNKALEYINKGMDYVKNFTNRSDYSKLLNEKAYCLAQLKRYEEAKKAYKESYEMAMQSNMPTNAIIHLKMLAEIEDILNNDKQAYVYLKEAYSLYDSINKEEFKETIAELETKFDAAQKERDIEELSNKTHTQKILIWSSIILMIIILSFFIYASAQRKKRIQQQLHMIEQEKEIQVSHALMDGEEQERLRLARDLHDGLGGTITAIKIKLEDYARKENNVLLNHTVEQLDKAVNELRATARNLIPENLMKFGLEEALRDYCISAQTQRTKINFYSNDLSSISDKNKQLIIYRIIQELINNALKHAEASKILVQITLEDALLLIDIEDNGKGFNYLSVKRNMGLNNIEMRVKYLEGKMFIDSQPGKGTSINIECKI